MGKFYNSRQGKVYEDYVGYPTDTLMEMLQSEKYMAEVNDVLKDILVARKAVPENYKQEKTISLSIESDKNDIEEERPKEVNTRQEEVNFFMKQLEHSSDMEIAEIITKYTNYQLPSVEAALITAEKRGTISSGEKKKLLSRIEKGFYEYSKKEEAITEEKMRKSTRNIQTGLIFIVIGIILTIWTMHNPIHGYYIVFFGFILFGAFLLYKGFFIDD